MSGDTGLVLGGIASFAAGNFDLVFLGLFTLGGDGVGFLAAASVLMGAASSKRKAQTAAPEALIGAEGPY